MKEQIVSCYNCKSEESNPYDIENGYRYVRCKGCGLIYLDQLPNENEIAAAHELGVHPGSLGLGHTKGKKANEMEMATTRNTKTGLSKGHGSKSDGKGAGLDRAEGKKGVGRGSDGKGAGMGSDKGGGRGGGKGSGKGGGNGGGNGGGKGK